STKLTLSDSSVTKEDLFRQDHQTSQGLIESMSSVKKTKKSAVKDLFWLFIHAECLERFQFILF
ncbi:hypothetical protein OAH08_01965, partial [Verrucomicrobia bacterium]|nr:hypothetical protein [Verrucomicrobiota bacterium]